MQVSLSDNRFLISAIPLQSVAPAAEERDSQEGTKICYKEVQWNVDFPQEWADSWYARQRDEIIIWVMKASGEVRMRHEHIALFLLEICSNPYRYLYKTAE